MPSKIKITGNLPCFIEEAVAVPYTPFGRDKSGWDCWGLIYIAYKELLGLSLPSYREDYTDPENRLEVHALFEQGKNAPEWHKVESPDLLDLVLLRISGGTWHVGLIVKKGWMLHSLKTGTHCVRTSAIQWAKRIDSYYRHESFIEQ